MTFMFRWPSQDREVNWFFDHDGYLTRYKMEDDAVTDYWDFTDWLTEIGSTISTVSWQNTSGPTLGTPTATTGDGGANMAVYSTVTKTGQAELKITAADGSIRYFKIRWLPSDEAMVSVDYR